MTLPNPKKVVTEERLHDFYTEILPYLGRVDAGFTPVGSVIIMSGNEAPTNYLACDGTVYNISDYPELAAFYARSQGSCNFYGGNGTTTFAVPDWRGEFIRGAGTNSHANQGNGAAVGVHQDSTKIANNITNKPEASPNNVYFGSLADTNIPLVQNYDALQRAVAGTYVDVSVAKDSIINREDARPIYNTIRPTNTSVLFCVAVKNIYLNPSLDYSTEEKVVGTWIDGKPLYQKTIVPDSQILLPDKSIVYIQTGIGSNVIDTVASSEAYCRSMADGWYRELPKIQDNAAELNVTYQVNVISGKLDIFGRNGNSSAMEFSHATIRYTKLAD